MLARWAAARIVHSWTAIDGTGIRKADSTDAVRCLMVEPTAADSRRRLPIGLERHAATYSARATRSVSRPPGPKAASLSTDRCAGRHPAPVRISTAAGLLGLRVSLGFEGGRNDRRLPATMDEQPGFRPDKQQLRVMQLAFDHFVINGEWPILQFVRLMAAKEGIPNVDEPLEQLPRSYLYPRSRLLNPDQEVRLTIPALAWLEEAQPDLDLFLHILRMFGSGLETFEPSPREVRQIEVTAAAVRADLPEVTDLQLRKMFSLLQAEPLGHSKGHPAERPAEWQVSMPPEEAARLGKVTVVGDYLAVRHVFPDELPHAGVGTGLIGDELRGDLAAPTIMLQDRVGSGGYGEVYTATVKETGERVACKRLLAQWARDDAARRRFEREVRLQQALSHPNIMPIYESDLAANEPWYTMPLGGTDLVGPGRANVGNDTFIAEVFLPVLHAVRAAHGAGVMHRDIKPQNVLQLADLRWVLSDFGTAREIDRTTTTITRSKEGIGTFDYMSPEQYRDSALCDERTDIFSLGKLLLFLILGDIFDAFRPAALPPHRFFPVLDRALQSEPDHRERPRGSRPAANSFEGQAAAQRRGVLRRHLVLGQAKRRGEKTRVSSSSAARRQPKRD